MLQLNHVVNFEILMGFYWSSYELSNLKKMIEDKLDRVKNMDSNLDSSQKIALLEETKQAFLLNMSGLGTKKFKNTQLIQLKTDLINLYDELCVLLEIYRDAQETKLFLDRRQQIIEAQKVSPSDKETLKFSEALNEYPKAAFSSKKAPSSTDIVFQYTETLLRNMISNYKTTDPLYAAIRAFDIYREHAASNNETGVFMDPYTRAAYPSPIKQKNLTYLSCTIENPSDPSTYMYVYSYTIDPLFKKYCSKYHYDSGIGPINLEGNLIGYIIGTKKDVKEFLEFFGLFGAILPRDSLLQLFCQNALKGFSLDQLFDKIRLLLSQRHQKPLEQTAIKPYEYSEKNLDFLIIELENCLKNSALKEMNQFYYQATLNLLLHLKKLNPQETPDTLFAINRMVHLINISKYCEYNQFIDCISLIWDEIRWLAKPNDILLPDAQKELYDKTIKTLKTYSGYLSDSLPAAVFLGSSCMNVIVRSVDCALMQLTQDNTKIIAARSGKNNYYEIVTVLSHLLRFSNYTLESEKDVYTDGMTDIAQPTTWPPNLIHLYINTIEAPVLPNSPGFEYTHVNDFIEEQLELRTRLSNSDPLICILDMTMGYMNDVFIKWILAQFKEALAKGQLYLFFTHSLNKFWGMGLDKGSAGFCHQYGNLEHFPIIKQKLEQEARELNLGGYLVNSSTVSFIELIMSSCPKMSDAYLELIRARSRFIYTNILNSVLRAKKSYVIIDDPLSYPHLKDRTEPFMELSNCSTFVTVRINPNYTSNKYFSELFFSCAYNLLASLNIKGRDGYGFAKTSFCNMSPTEHTKIIRISIGSESQEVLTTNFARISNFILQFNKNMEAYLPLIREEYEDDDSAITLQALRVLARGFLKQYPIDELFTAKYDEIELIIQKMAHELGKPENPLDEAYDETRDLRYKP